MLYMATVAGSLMLFAVVVFGETDTQAKGSISEALTMILAVTAVLGVLANVAWSFFNRKHYDKLKETIAEKDMIIASKEQRHFEHKATCESQIEKLNLAIAAFGSQVQNLQVSNEAVVKQNLQMKAQLKKYLPDPDEGLGK
jgi:predicted negative regulator of RcsB-dependent stress response